MKENKKYVCQICHIDYQNAQNLAEHRLLAHDETFCRSPEQRAAAKQRMIDAIER